MRTALVLVAALSATPACAAERPNVLFIAIDDLNDWVGPLGGHPQAKTPNLDKLAARGTTFTNAHCQAPLCNPSRTSVLTGLRPSTTGVYALAPWFRTSEALKDHATLFQWFKKNGYATTSVGKIFHGGYPPAKDRAAEVDAFGPPHPMPRPKAKFVQTPDPTPLMDWGVFPEKDEGCFDYDVATWAVKQLAEPRKEPWFFAVGFQHPHVPCYAPQKWFDLYPEEKLVMPAVKADDRADVPRFADYLHWKLPEPRLKWLEESKQWKPLVRAYLASVSFVDAQVGRVLDALAASGQDKNTIVVLWSDHGWHLGEKGITGKNTLWERSTRVPLIFAGPGVAAGAKCGRPAELLDLYPTLAELAGLPANAAVEGQSLVPQLKDAKAARERPAVTTHNPGNHSARTEQWRYIRYADGSEELYDVVADPNEWSNLAAKPEHADLKKQLAKWMPAKSAAPLPGSAGRILTFDNGVPVWEGKPIGKDDPFPEK
ncbi:choline sulfatase : Arylsulfatase A family protein OS=Singulisphaera acidiphila (strain ATCC BAA-1392 / DSM 18658 / VKM B-2454 / MOB10) GN=Sinac_6946 PE=4 SV=1: Sulfatase [Gemmataceae bacterium]|nr:choline sulfatase : Arylsulfatase A family protein OS=Singulisphaera acidiphila (strain ATCC BAA-1392 / DSM 18658 / VKM B-2454 / MOB10) GN=Sinac_6946 PE=4 SV=1: Sulfatase [Gemmataceae bacterium]VTU02043.1 choline sulfatase : Arylsulfatase A family protein OS=Singulisphaera acidiphila (strain ATCC BAA-1392 / DSM 18658 / VKM B-2454 / MOB10) GN=Sinac_6946 PE=4 SV=1: Sulfatase [Gemmataceae bacterium]